MRHLQTEVLVIGGGATGTGVVRDLAMRGFKTILVERRDLTYGTTGRYHGLLHSGGRYVVRDPLAAKECIEENRILRHIMPQCIEDTGGFFVLTPWDDPAYAPRFVQGCQQAGIPCEEIPIAQMLREEPLLNPKIRQCFRVPDGAADSFLAAELNAASARQYGAQILTYHEVTRLLRYEDGIAGVHCLDLVKNEKVQIDADLVINAAGAWTGRIAAMAGLNVEILPGKGTMIAVNHRLVNTVINRCKMPSDGDILVPAHTVAVMGTTDIKVGDPEVFSIEPWEIRLMLEEGEKIIPGFSSFRVLRAWAGVRPLYIETKTTEQNREVSRAFVLLDHEERDGLKGLLTITSGKWTTYRKMAEVTVDKVCQKLKTQRACRTHIEELPKPDHTSPARHHYLGMRLAEIEKRYALRRPDSIPRLICECELATDEDILHSIVQGEARTLDDIRRDARLGMGPCQGGFCTLRAAGLLHQLRHPPVIEINVALRDFLKERWKGLIPILWGQQLRQERLNELIYLNILNVDHLPGPKESQLAAVPYLSPEENQAEAPATAERPTAATIVEQGLTRLEATEQQRVGAAAEILIIGGGLAGLFAAWQAATSGKKVRLITKGWGATHWASGCIDILGYSPIDAARPVSAPLEALQSLAEASSQHPYSLVGEQTLVEAIHEFQTLCNELGYPLQGSLERNWLLPTAAGARRPTCLVPETMIAGDLKQRTPMLIVGFAQFTDFYPALIAENLNAQAIFASDLLLDLPSLQKRRSVNGIALARLFDTPEFRQEVVELLKPRLANAARVGFPAVLGLKHTLEAKKDLEDRLGISVFEIPGLPPSIPGIRLHNLLRTAIEAHGGQVFDGMQVNGVETQKDEIVAVYSEAAARRKSHHAMTFILATGGILGGGVTVSNRGYAQDTAIQIPLSLSADRNAWFQPDFLSSSPHPLYQTGFSVNSQLQPVNPDGEPFYRNLYAIGSALGNCDPVRERSMEGIALATAYFVGKKILQ